jgi:nucleotide-binding universal stress UspA family protein
MTDIKTPEDHIILVPVDFSESSTNALEYAVEMAKLFDDEIMLLNVISGGMKSLFLSENLKQSLKEGITLRLENYKKNILEKWPNAKVSVKIEEGKPYKVITKVAEEHKCDSIVMGTNGANAIEQFVGSTTSRTINVANCPVIVVKERHDKVSFNNIVLPIDLTKSSKQKVNWAIKIAKRYNSTVHIIMEMDDDEFIKHKISANLKQVENAMQENGVKSVSKLLDDRKYPDNIGMDTIQYAKEIDADLIIIMTQAEGGLAELFVGSYAQQVVNSSQKTPVMCINPRKTYSYVGVELQ